MFPAHLKFSRDAAVSSPNSALGGSGGFELFHVPFLIHTLNWCKQNFMYLDLH